MASATTTETTTTVTTATPIHKDSMKSTWRTWDKGRWTRHHWLFEILGIHPTDFNRNIPVHQKTDKMPYLPHYEGHKWILVHAIWPLLVNQLYVYYYGKSMHLFVAFLFYTFAFKANAIHEIHALRNLGHQYGYLDGDKHERDQVPDLRVRSALNSLISTATIRPMLCVFAAYRSSTTPLSTLSWWLPLEIGLYSTVLDFWFYWYHRLMHESDTLWKFHRTHHLTKHPTPVLSLYADEVQEFFDIVGIPLLAYGSLRLMGLPMGFADWWICQQYIVWTELFGHSGLRVLVTPPTTATPILKLLDAELVTEDHDLHHRKGWKSSHNYGKQTLLWDRLFGTTFERYESPYTDWNSPARMPIW